MAEPAPQSLVIPLRDGIETTALLWLPIGGSPAPAILLRTPYSIEAGEFQRLRFQGYIDAGFAVVLQQVRGCGDSGGDFTFFRHEGRDGYDSVEWVAVQPWCNGRVGMDGGSYLGTAQWLAAREQPPHLRCIAPAVAAGQWFDEIPYKGGALMIDWATSWLAALAGVEFDLSDAGITHLEDYRPIAALHEKLGVQLPLLDEILAHPTFDSYWRELYFEDDDFDRIQVPVFVVTGWFDGDQAGALHYWHGIERRLRASLPSQLVIGPWMHGECYQGGVPKLEAMHFGEHSVVDIQQRRIDFFNAFLHDNKATFDSHPRVQLFVTGSNDWRDAVQYPPTEARGRALYLAASRALADTTGQAGLVEYRYDPANPMPYRQGAADHTDLLERDDVICFHGDVLKAPLLALGPVRLQLFAGSDGPDTDFVAALYDIDTEGRAISLSHMYGVMRARYRQGFERSELLAPGEPVELNLRLPDIGHCFQPGHRVAVMVTSSCFPLIDPNTNTGEDFRHAIDSRVATQQIHFGVELPSALHLTVVEP